jgi:outer membrane protein assembly factor BamA
MNMSRSHYVLALILSAVASAAVLAPSDAPCEEQPQLIQPVGRFAPGPGDRIADIEIKSPGGINLADIRKILDVNRGDPFSIESVRHSTKLLYQTGLFSDIAVYTYRKANQISLVFELNPRLRVNKVKLTGNKHVPDLEVMRAVRVDKNDEFIPQNVTQMEMDVRKLMEKSGFMLSKVNIIATQLPGTIKYDLEVRIEEGPPERISEIRFEGHAHFPPEAILDEMGLHQGDRLDMTAIEKKVTWLKEYYKGRGFPFAVVKSAKAKHAHDGRTAELIIPVVSGGRMKITFDAPKGVPVKTLRKAVEKALEDREGADVQYLIENLKDQLVVSGFAFAEVKARLIKNGEYDRDVLVFVVSAGPQVLVRDIRFTGNMNVPGEKLNDTVAAAADEYRPVGSIFEAVRIDEPDRGLIDDGQSYLAHPDFAPLYETDPEIVFVQDKFDKAAQSLAEQYKSMGFLEPRIARPEVQFSPDNKLVTLTYKIVEGPQTFIKSIKFAGNTSFSNYYLSYQLKSLFSSSLNLYEVEEARIKIQQLYAEHGFAYVTVSDELKFSGDRTDADVIYHIDEGRQVRVDRIVLQGNDSTHDSIVIGNLNFRPGDLYKPSSVTKSQSNLLKLQTFQSAGISLLDPDEMASFKDVGVFVKERIPQMFKILGGVSTEDGIRAGAEYTHLNLGGRALELTARLKLSWQVFAYVPGMMNADVAEQFRELPWYDAIAREANISLNVPRIYQVPFNMSARVDLVNERINERAYFEDRTAVTPGIEMQLADPLTLLLSYTFEYDFITRSAAVVPSSQLTQQEQQVLNSPQGVLWLGTIRPTLVLDYRDDKFNPHSGFMFKVASEYTMSFTTPKTRERIIIDPFDTTKFVSTSVQDANVNFIKLYGNFSFYIPTSKHTTLAFLIGGGNIFLLGDNSVTTANSVFYMGGRSTLRGFQEQSMFPADISDYRKHTSSGGTAISPGGNTYILYKAEFRFPLTAGFEGGLFVEAGNLWLDPKNFNPIKLRPCVGLGMRYRTPVGPVAVDVGFNLTPDKSISEPAAALQFSVGVF